MRSACIRSIRLVLILASLGALPVGAAAQTAAAGPSCDEFLLAPREVKGKKVGPTSCRMQETDMTFEGRTFKRLDIGLDGTVEGYLTKTGDYKEYLTNAPDLVFQQTADPGPHSLRRRRLRA